MTNYVCRYPDGAAGLGLLFLRTCYASVAFGIAAPATAIDSYLRFPAAALIALLLVLGFATRLAALLLGTAAAVALSTSSPPAQWLLAGHVGACAAIALLGAGALSVDARLHGRRVIHLQMSTPERGTDK
jgi:putative oxidoreductase